jgi:hypothetical protein
MALNSGIVADYRARFLPTGLATGDAICRATERTLGEEGVEGRIPTIPEVMR